MILERVYITPKELDEIENRYIITRHVERYAIVRQYCYGDVLDIACGCGYGSKLLSEYYIFIDKDCLWQIRPERTQL